MAEGDLLIDDEHRVFAVGMRDFGARGRAVDPATLRPPGADYGARPALAGRRGRVTAGR